MVSAATSPVAGQVGVSRSRAPSAVSSVHTATRSPARYRWSQRVTDRIVALMISRIGYRLRANRLDVRGPLADALPAGLQDSAPRAAQLSLHARVDGLPVDGWADPSLRQLWGPRGAAYLVAAADWAVFTVGRLPRSGADQLLALADRVVELLG